MQFRCLRAYFCYYSFTGCLIGRIMVYRDIVEIKKPQYAPWKTQDQGVLDAGQGHIWWKPCSHPIFSFHASSPAESMAGRTSPFFNRVPRFIYFFYYFFFLSSNP